MLRGERTLSNQGEAKKVVCFELSSQLSRQLQAEKRRPQAQANWEQRECAEPCTSG